MVMPRSRSMSIESRYCSRIRRGSTAPVSSRIRSDSVDLPWSTWLMIEKLRMRSVGDRSGRVECGRHGPSIVPAGTPGPSLRWAGASTRGSRGELAPRRIRPDPLGRHGRGGPGPGPPAAGGGRAGRCAGPRRVLARLGSGPHDRRPAECGLPRRQRRVPHQWWLGGHRPGRPPPRRRHRRRPDRRRCQRGLAEPPWLLHHPHRRGQGAGRGHLHPRRLERSSAPGPAASTTRRWRPKVSHARRPSCSSAGRRGRPGGADRRASCGARSTGAGGRRRARRLNDMRPACPRAVGPRDRTVAPTGPPVAPERPAPGPGREDQPGTWAAIVAGRRRSALDRPGPLRAGPDPGSRTTPGHPSRGSTWPTSAARSSATARTSAAASATRASAPSCGRAPSSGGRAESGAQRTTPTRCAWPCAGSTGGGPRRDPQEPGGEPQVPPDAPGGRARVRRPLSPALSGAPRSPGAGPAGKVGRRGSRAPVRSGAHSGPSRRGRPRQSG